MVQAQLESELVWEHDGLHVAFRCVGAVAAGEQLLLDYGPQFHKGAPHAGV